LSQRANVPSSNRCRRQYAARETPLRRQASM
jgi:hypothetical protein